MEPDGIERINVDELKVIEAQAQKLSSRAASDLGLKTKAGDKLVTLEVLEDSENETLEVKVKVPRLLYGGWKEFLSDNARDTLISVLFVCFALLNIVKIVGFALAIESLNIGYTAMDNYLLDIAIAVAPLMIWALSTNYTKFNFRNIKLGMFHSSFFFVNLLLIRFVYIVSYDVFVPLIGGINITEEITAGKVVGLAYIATFVPTILITILLFYIASKWTSLSKDFMMLIEDFRLFKVFDPVTHSKHEYVFKAVKNINDGEQIVISQKDRQMHTAVIGATGTGKTSSVLLQSILNDLKVRVLNKEALKKAMKHYVEKGLFIITTPFDDADFSPKYFKPNSQYKCSLLDRVIGRTPDIVYNYLISKYEIAGQTILAPEESLPDDAYDLFMAYGEKANRVDPKLIDGKHKPGFKGMNILFISPFVPDWQLSRERVRRATLLADVMQIMFEMGGKSDPYFASVNRIATTTIALLLQLTFPTLKGRQPNLVDVQEHLNDFKRLIEPTDYLFPGGTINAKNKKYEWLYDNIRNFFLGAGAETFEQHARGLKVQYSLFLADDYIRELVAAEEVIDFDDMLANNELTVVNIELPEIGPINSPALGLFFSVNMTNAVLRRPGTEWTRSFHPWRIDEFPIVVTPSMEQAFTLFRKFKVPMEVAMQTLDQMDKTPYLKYLKPVILNSTANQIVFGRANLSEMETYSAMSGMIDDFIDMEGVTETSLFTENPTMSVNTRKTKTKVLVNELSDIRNKDFQEITYIYTRRGSLMPPVHGKVEFMSKKDKKPSKKRKKYDWAKLVEKQCRVQIDSIPANVPIATNTSEPKEQTLSQVVITGHDDAISSYTLDIKAQSEVKSSYVLDTKSEQLNIGGLEAQVAPEIVFEEPLEEHINLGFEEFQREPTFENIPTQPAASSEMDVLEIIIDLYAPPEEPKVNSISPSSVSTVSVSERTTPKPINTQEARKRDKPQKFDFFT